MEFVILRIRLKVSLSIWIVPLYPSYEVKNRNVISIAFGNSCIYGCTMKWFLPGFTNLDFRKSEGWSKCEQITNINRLTQSKMRIMWKFLILMLLPGCSEWCEEKLANNWTVHLFAKWHIFTSDTEQSWNSKTKQCHRRLHAYSEQLKHNAGQRKHKSPGKQCVFVQKRKRSIREAVVNISLMSCVPNEQKFVYIFQLHFARELKETGQWGWFVKGGNEAKYIKCREKETDRCIWT